METFTEGEAAEELISLVSKSAHAETEEKVLGSGDCQDIDDDQQPQDLDILVGLVKRNTGICRIIIFHSKIPFYCKQTEKYYST